MGPIDHYPARMRPGDAVDGIIVVGATDNHGRLAVFTQMGLEIALWAPGENVPCAGDSDTLDETVYQSGTSQGMISTFSIRI